LPRGNYKQFSLVGIDEQTFVGGPARMILGNLSDLRQADAIILDKRGFNFLFPNQEPRIGWTVEMNEKRAIVVGICESSPTFQTFPIAYTLYSRALYFAPQERRVMSFVLAQGDPGLPEEEVCRRITDRTGLMALTKEGFSWRTIVYYLKRTGIPINFGITVFLGFVIGAAIAGQTFYLFTLDNLKQYGALKAMGVTNLQILGMVLTQALVVGILGYSIGVGLASGLEEIVGALVGRQGIPPASLMVWQIPMFTAAACTLIVAVASLFSLRKVLVLEPASVFR
jgi:putative ABC transport system permease protein